MSSHDAVYDEVLQVFQEALDFPMAPDAQSAFNRVYDTTIGPALAQNDWGKSKGWVLSKVRRIALRAQKNAGTRPISYRDLARAANCLIPELQDACRELMSAEDRAIRGEWCIDFDEIPEEEGS